ncbi:MAG: hypothetical protein CMP22_01645 [Rickettsiales bacterium]|nr:hypothetical protein [Rickettsiales bacterium]|tara:strand:+ start:402 stop:1316 length:915 start_codon:yes stop_codon:yes gene_type:complete
MRIFIIFLFALLFNVAQTQAHSGDHKHADDSAHMIPIAIEQNKVKITEEGDYLFIESNGIPEHATGNFPNRENPNAISAQRHRFRVTQTPNIADRVSTRVPVIGVALNGIPIEPGTAECYGQTKENRKVPVYDCMWREEAIVNGKGQLGLDWSNAHVQPGGVYHYHGIPNGLLHILPDDDLVHVGYAADGFKIYVSRSDKYNSSYRLKMGTRPSAPGGRFDGTYTQDFEFIYELGSLDECNGMRINGEYGYFLTKRFPFAPRCLRGTVDESFLRHKKYEDPTKRLYHNRPTPHELGREHHKRRL